jgi:hypothetical protein
MLILFDHGAPKGVARCKHTPLSPRKIEVGIA